MPDDTVTFSKQQLEMNNLMIQLSANVATLMADMKEIKASQLALATQLETRVTAINTSLEPRIRALEDSVNKLLPIPSVSHEALVKQVNDLNEKVDCIDKTKNQLFGGWKVVVLISGIVVGVINFILILARLLDLIK